MRSRGVAQTDRPGGCRPGPGPPGTMRDTPLGFSAKADDTTAPFPAGLSADHAPDLLPAQAGSDLLRPSVVGGNTTGFRVVLSGF